MAVQTIHCSEAIWHACSNKDSVVVSRNVGQDSEERLPITPSLRREGVEGGGPTPLPPILTNTPTRGVGGVRVKHLHLCVYVAFPHGHIDAVTGTAGKCRGLRTFGPS